MKFMNKPENMFPSGPKEPWSFKNEPKELKFEPDKDKLIKIARFRRITLLVTLVLIVAAFIWVLFLPARLPVHERDKKTESRVTEELPVAMEKEVAPRVPERVVQSAGLNMAPARLAVARIDSGLGAAVQAWPRAEKVLAGNYLSQETVAEFLKRIEVAKAIADTVSRLVQNVEIELERLGEIMLKAVGKERVRVGAVFAAARDYLKLVKEETSDRQNWLVAYEQAAQALGRNDRAEFEIKENVAVGFLRKCEARRRRLYRAGERLREVNLGF